MSEQINRPPARARSGRVIALLLIGAGALVLIANIGLLGAALWSVLWPLALVAIGIDLITEGRQRRRIVLGGLLALAVLTPLVGGAELVDRGRARLGGSRDERIALQDVDRVQAQINVTAGSVQINALSDESDEVVRLIEGAQGSYTTDDRIGVLDVSPADGWGEVGDVELELTQRVPLDLTINLGAGSAEPLDLHDLQLERLDLTVTAGNAVISLPDTGVMEITINGGVGEIDLDVPNDLPARIELSSDLGEISFDEDRFTRDGNTLISNDYDENAPNRATIQITSGPGEITID